jgi:hypothetical protein
LEGEVAIATLELEYLNHLAALPTLVFLDSAPMPSSAARTGEKKEALGQGSGGSSSFVFDGDAAACCVPALPVLNDITTRIAEAHQRIDDLRRRHAGYIAEAAARHRFSSDRARFDSEEESSAPPLPLHAGADGMAARAGPTESSSGIDGQRGDADGAPTESMSPAIRGGVLEDDVDAPYPPTPNNNGEAGDGPGVLDHWWAEGAAVYTEMLTDPYHGLFVPVIDNATNRPMEYVGYAEVDQAGGSCVVPTSSNPASYPSAVTLDADSTSSPPPAHTVAATTPPAAALARAIVAAEAASVDLAEAELCLIAIDAGDDGPHAVSEMAPVTEASLSAVDASDSASAANAPISDASTIAYLDLALGRHTAACSDVGDANYRPRTKIDVEGILDLDPETGGLIVECAASAAGGDHGCGGIRQRAAGGAASDSNQSGGFASASAAMFDLVRTEAWAGAYQIFRAVDALGEDGHAAAIEAEDAASHAAKLAELQPPPAAPTTQTLVALPFVLPPLVGDAKHLERTWLRPLGTARYIPPSPIDAPTQTGAAPITTDASVVGAARPHPFHHGHTRGRVIEGREALDAAAVAAVAATAATAPSTNAALLPVSPVPDLVLGEATGLGAAVSPAPLARGGRWTCSLCGFANESQSIRAPVPSAEAGEECLQCGVAREVSDLLR